MESTFNLIWDFVEVGKTYLLHESGFYSIATVLEDNSSEEYYIFKMRYEKSSSKPYQPIITVERSKKSSGGCSGLVSIIKLEKNTLNPDFVWEWEFNGYKIDFKFDVFKEMLNDSTQVDFIFESCLNPDFFINTKLQHDSMIDNFLNLFRNKKIPDMSFGTSVYQVEPERFCIKLKNPDATFHFYPTKSNTIEFDLECYLVGLIQKDALFNPCPLDINLIYSDCAKNILDRLQTHFPVMIFAAQKQIHLRSPGKKGTLPPQA